MFWVCVLIFSLVSLLVLTLDNSKKVKGSVDKDLTINDLTSTELEDMLKNNAPQDLIEQEVIRLRMQESIKQNKKSA